jgi:hypothetical protein
MPAERPEEGTKAFSLQRISPHYAEPACSREQRAAAGGDYMIFHMLFLKIFTID